MDYKGVKISDEVLIVENASHQGYVVDKGNKKMLETAMSWGKSYDRQTKSYIDPKVHTYINGKFKLALQDAAYGSVCGGKLSFWNCKITAPDGKEFIIGINAELLLDVLLSHTFKKGVLSKDCYLGRVNGNQVGVFTESMEAYKQSKKDDELRKQVKNGSFNYEVGDVVETLTKKEVYLGIGYQYFDYIQEYRGIGYGRAYIIKIFKKPKMKHMFGKFSYEGDVYASIYGDFRDKKPKRVSTGEKINITAKKAWNTYMKKQGTHRYNFEHLISMLMYGVEDKQYTIAELKEAIHKSRQEQDLSTSTLWNRNELIIEVEE